MKKELNVNMKCYIAKEIVSEFETEEGKRRTDVKRNDRSVYKEIDRGAVELSDRYLFERYCEEKEKAGKELDLNETELKTLMTEYTSKGILRKSGTIPMRFGNEELFRVIKRSPDGMHKLTYDDVKKRIEKIYPVSEQAAA